MNDLLIIKTLNKVQFWQETPTGKQRPIKGFITAKAQALLIYLVQSGKLHARNTLATLLWSEVPDASAAANLRNVLSNLRKLVGDYLVINQGFVGFNFSQPYRIDTAQFALTVGKTECPELLHAALDQHGAGFLHDMRIRKAPIFEEWQQREWGKYRRLYEKGLLRLLGLYRDVGQYQSAYEVTELLIALQPWDETIARARIELLIAHENHSAALLEYERFRQVLWDEIRVTPSAEMEAFYGRLITPNRLIPNNLQPEQLPFFGRGIERTQLHQLLAAPNCRLITIVGSGGVGKTRLALKVANELCEHNIALADFPDGVYFIPLANIDASLYSEPWSLDLALVTAVADAIGLNYEGNAPMFEQAERFLAHRRLLLIFDNAEHVIDRAVRLQELLGDCPYMKILVTSRERLNLMMEWVFRLEGFCYSAEINSAAYQFFAQQAQQIVGSFDLASNSDSVRRICTFVNGLPLGIKLAAHWLPLLSPQTIADEMAQSLDLLATQQSDSPPRHRSLRALFNSTWRLLQPSDQQAVQRLSVFTSSFSISAARSVAQLSQHELLRLVDKSLIQRDNNGLFELIPHFHPYIVPLVTVYERDALRQRHLQHYASMLGELGEMFNGQTPQKAVQLIKSQEPEIYTAWRFGIEQMAAKEIGAMQFQLSRYWRRTGLAERGLIFFEEALVAFDLANFPRLHGRLLLEYALLHNRMGQQIQAVAALHAALPLLEQDSDQQPLLAAYLWLGRLQGMLKAYDSAETILQKAIALTTKLKFPRLLAIAHRHLGWLLHTRLLQNQLDGIAHDVMLADSASAHFVQSLQLTRHHQLVEDEGMALGMIGQLAHTTGCMEQAHTAFQQALVCFQHIKLPVLAACVHLNLVWCELWAGSQDAALTHFRAGYATTKLSGDRVCLRRAILAAAQLYGATGQIEQQIVCLAHVCEHPDTVADWRLEAQLQLRDLRGSYPDSADAVWQGQITASDVLLAQIECDWGAS